MPTYPMRCRTCGTRFEVIRPMARIDDPAPCPGGHDDTVRLLAVVAVTGAQPAAPGRGRAAAAPSGGGCCGGGCCG